jgi:nitrogen fixation protein NifU and related proteins
LASKFYSKKTLELFLNPPNTGLLAGHNGRGEATNTACSDHAVITVRIEHGVIADLRFQTQGCAAAIASGAATVLMAKGMKVQDALGIDVDAVVEFLGGLPEAKIGCSVIAPEALRAAIDDWRLRS